MERKRYKELIEQRGPGGEIFCARCNAWANHDERSPDCPKAKSCWGTQEHEDMTEWLIWNRRVHWFDAKLYDKFTVICPTCGPFEWQGHFYAPQCPKCKMFFKERPL